MGEPVWRRGAALLALVALPGLAILVIVVGLSSDGAPETVDDTAGRQIMGEPQDIAIPSEGLDLTDIEQMRPESQVLVFGTRQHGASLESTDEATTPPVVEAADITGVGGWGQVVLVVFEGSEVETAAGLVGPWWYPDHDSAIQDDGAAACFDCHDEVECSHCHINRAARLVEAGLE